MKGRGAGRQGRMDRPAMKHKNRNDRAESGRMGLMKILEKTCPICGETFWPNTKGQIYCGKSCASIGRERRRKENREKKSEKPPEAVVFEKACAVCGRKFRPRTRTQIYCGKVCKAEAERVRKSLQYREKTAAQPKRICPVCGKEFQSIRSQQTFCSSKCARKQFDPAVQERRRERPQKMANIRITEDIPVFPELRPETGAIYRAEVNDGGRDERRFYVVTVNGKRVIVREEECTEL